MAMKDGKRHSARRPLILILVLCTAVMLTIANISTPTTGIPMFYVYTTNSTSGNGDVWVDFGLYGYCTWAPRTVANDSYLAQYW